jgi:hypothetical protein
MKATARTGLWILSVFIAFVAGLQISFDSNHKIFDKSNAPKNSDSILVDNSGISRSIDANIPSTKIKKKPTVFPELDIMEISTRVTEKNNVWWKFAWKLKVKLDTSSLLSSRIFDAKLKWLDKDGYVIDDDIEYRLNAKSGREETFTGYTLITYPEALNVHSISVELENRF